MDNAGFLTSSGKARAMAARPLIYLAETPGSGPLSFWEIRASEDDSPTSSIIARREAFHMK